MEPEWRIELLGGLRAVRGTQAVDRFRTRKTADLLAYLACSRQRSHPRELLVELLWPESDPQAGRHNLSMALSSLRRALEPAGVTDGSVILADRHAVGLNSSAVVTDVAEFEEALRTASRSEGDDRAHFLAAAVERYRGPLLPGFYDDWVGPEQQRLDELFHQALRHLIGHLEARGAVDQALIYALQAVQLDRLREEDQREVIRLYLVSGQTTAALRQYEELKHCLEVEFHRPPAAETRALVERFAEGSGGADERPPEIRVADVSPVSQATRGKATKSAPPGSLPPASGSLEPVGGAVSLTSRYYIVRPADAELRDAITRRDSIVLVKGTRQVGKTSLLVRGLQEARREGARVVLTHFQTFNAADLESAESLLLALGETLAEQLDLQEGPAAGWNPRLGANMNFRRYLRREVLSRPGPPLLWGLEEVDRLFSCPFASEIFGLFRSWHDERALEPEGPWSNLTLAMVYSTEAHLFITDVNQSPFNVGTRLTLSDFTLEEVAELNRRYGSPLREAGELQRLYGWVGGHPYLVRRCLHEMVAHGADLSTVEARSTSDDWILGEHLRRMVLLLSRDAELSNAVREVLQSRPCPSQDSFYRLRSAGVLLGESPRAVWPRCELYARYLGQHLL